MSPFSSLGITMVGPGICLQKRSQCQKTIVCINLNRQWKMTLHAVTRLANIGSGNIVSPHVIKPLPKSMLVDHPVAFTGNDQDLDHGYTFEHVAFMITAICPWGHLLKSVFFMFPRMWGWLPFLWYWYLRAAVFNMWWVWWLWWWIGRGCPPV